ncbi:MAG: hypothetical protein ACLS6U_09425 [Streptococcus salivarius]
MTNLEKLVQKIQYDIDTQLKLPRQSSETSCCGIRSSSSRSSSKELDQSVYQERLEHELDIIHQMGFDDYLNCLGLVSDRSRLMGMGRGSGVGSLVAYA